MVQKPKGTYDVIGTEGEKLLHLEGLLQALMKKYNYNYIRTPLFEMSELFHREAFETTDIVTKETYDFKDRGGRNMTLRPEGTAGTVRAYLENKMYADSIVPSKNWYYGPMYRYERPQAGRYREFYQFGVEVFGSSDPMIDAEVISIPVNFYKQLGLRDVKVNINTLGDFSSRKKYREALLEYLKPYLDDLCDDCKKRFLKNPLRILDCKIDSHKDFMKNPPKITAFLNEDSQSFFQKVQEYLKAMNIDFSLNPNIVRGLDYYTHTVFEVEASVEGFGANNVLCGGGRYDGLVEQVGGKMIPGVGFAMGMERLLTALNLEKISVVGGKSIDIYIIPVEESDKRVAIEFLQNLRLNNFVVETDYMSANMKNNFKRADRLHSKFILILGEEEKKTGILTIKDNRTKDVYKIRKEEMVNFFHDHIT